MGKKLGSSLLGDLTKTTKTVARPAPKKAARPVKSLKGASGTVHVPQPKSKPIIANVEKVKPIHLGTPKQEAKLKKAYPHGLPNDITVGEVRKAAGIQPLKESVVGPALAPTLTVLDQTTRPVHAIAAATDAAITGKSIGHAALQGLKNKDKASFSRVLKHLGAPKAVQDVGGFAGDVFLDPTTYVSLGTGIARKAGARAAEDAAKGVTIKVAGKRAPLVTPVTAGAGKVLRKAGARAATKPGGRSLAKVGAAAKDLARDVRPQMAPAGADKAQYQAARAITREGRAAQNHAASEAQRHAEGLAARLDRLRSQHGVTHEAVARALDTGDMGHLPKAAHAEVQDIARRFKQLHDARKAGGVEEGEIHNYYPRAREDALHERHGIVASDSVPVRASGPKRSGPTLGSSKTRTDRRPLHEVNPERVAEGKAPFSTDVPLVYANYARDTGRAVAQNHVFRELAILGRPYREGDLLKPNEAVYALGHREGKLGLRPYKEGEKVQKGDKLVTLDEKTIDTVLRRSTPAQAGSAVGRTFDKGTAAFKRIATFTPGFHFRNALGDTQMAYLSQPGHVLPRNVAQAAKVNRANVRLEKAQRKSLSSLVPDSGKTIKVAGKRMPAEQLARWAREDGVTNSGQIGRELKDLAVKGDAPKRVRSKVARGLRKPVAKVEPTVRGRENVIRLATYKHGLDRGLSRREAADLSLETHIDYGDLTELERKALRRAMPFYTFTARSTPLHIKRLVQRPGKVANFQKAREDVSNATGGSPESGLNDFQQRQAPFAIGNRVVSASLPIASALNLIPTSTDPIKYANEVGQTAAGLLNPALKTWPEAYLNRSFYFRDDIEKADNPLVAAPSWVSHLPGSLKQKLGVVERTDKRTGQKVLKWRGKADYWMKAFTPGPGNVINQLLAHGTNRAGQGGLAKVLAGATGIKIQPIDAPSVAIGNAYAILDAMQKQYAIVKPDKGDPPSREAERLKAQIAGMKQHIHDLSVKRGDATPLGGQSKKSDPYSIYQSGDSGPDPYEIYKSKDAGGDPYSIYKAGG